MRLLLFHPGPASIRCDDCKRYIYDLETGERKTHPGPGGRELPDLRYPGMPLPCENCPKQSPAKEKEYRLSDRNWKTLELYEQVRASAGACLSEAERRDPILRRNLAIIDRIMRQYERRRSAEELSHQVALLFSRR